MAKQEIEFEVTLEKLSIRYKGSQEMGQRLQANLTRSIGNLVDTQRQAMLPARQAEPLNGQKTLFEAPVGEHETPAPPVAPVPPAEPLAEKKKPRKVSGVSLIGMLRDLKSKEKFFAVPRTVDAIREQLKLKGHTYKPSSIAARLLDMIQDDELFRSLSGEVYVYKDTKFDEVPRTEDAAAEPAK
jgi:hypothetical protein